MKSSKKITQILLLLIILMAVLLRIVFLDKVPPALYTDETNQGYNAYSILLTGRDEHGVFLPVSLRSFGDWKPPLPTYLMIPFVAVFGLNEIAVRFPSALFGIGTVTLSFYLVKEFFSSRHLPGGFSTKIALLSSFFLSISPWHILQSRSAMLVMISLFFLEAGIYSFIKTKDNPKWLYLSATSFVLSVYSYYGLRVVAPLILVVLFYFYRKNLPSLFKDYLLSGIVGLLLLLPLILAFKNQPDVIFGRAKTVSVFYDQGVKLRQWELITQDGVGASPFISRLFHNNIYMYGRSIIQRFLSHLDFHYLLLTGDKAPPFQIPNMGIIYFIDIFLIFSGLIYLYRKRFEPRHLIISWVLISIIPAAFTFMTPSSNRTFMAVIPFMILNSVGLLFLINQSFALFHLRGGRRTPRTVKGFSNYFTSEESRSLSCHHPRCLEGLYKKCKTLVIKIISKKLVAVGAISTLYALSFAYFLHQYFVNLPQKHANWWNYGMKETVDYVKTVEEDYDNIIIFDNGMPYIYFLFYDKVDPFLFQKQAIRSYIADQFGFEHVEGFGKYIFPKDWQWKYVKKNLQKRTLYIVSIEQAVEDNDYIKEIKYPDGRTKFKIFSS